MTVSESIFTQKSHKRYYYSRLRIIRVILYFCGGIKTSGMEGNKPIIFDDGLREAFEHPLKKYPTLQKVLLTDSENENEEDAFISKIIIPLCSVMYYLINKDAAVFEHFVKFIDDLGELKSIPRLDSNEIFETLSQLSFRNALLVLERNNFTDGTYTELKESLEEGDKRRFVTTLKDCNTTPSSPILKFLNIPHLVIQKFAALELEATKADFESNELLRQLCNLRKKRMNVLIPSWFCFFMICFSACLVVLMEKEFWMKMK